MQPLYVFNLYKLLSVSTLLLSLHKFKTLVSYQAVKMWSSLYFPFPMMSVASVWTKLLSMLALQWRKDSLTVHISSDILQFQSEIIISLIITFEGDSKLWYVSFKTVSALPKWKHCPKSKAMCLYLPFSLPGRLNILFWQFSNSPLHNRKLLWQEKFAATSNYG